MCQSQGIKYLFNDGNYLQRTLWEKVCNYSIETLKWPALEQANVLYCGFICQKKILFIYLFILIIQVIPKDYK